MMSETPPSYAPPTRQQLISRLHELVDGMLETTWTMRSWGNGGESEDHRLILQHADELMGARRMLNDWIDGLQKGDTCDD